MEINLETREQHTVQGYSLTHVRIEHVDYTYSIFVSQTVLEAWPVTTLNQCTLASLEPLINLHPEVILLGHTGPLTHLPGEVLAQLAKQRIGVEVMDLGAACRTFNVLLSEQRAVILGVIFQS